MEAMLPLFEPKGRVLLVDGHHLAYRTFFALKGLTTSRGEPVQAVYGFAKSLLKALKEDGYKAVFVVFDAKAPSFRHEAYEAYKAGRAPTPEDFPRQLALIKELVDLLGFTRLEVPGYEADDVLATLAKKAEKEGYEVRILTADRDLYQLVSDRVAVLHPEGHLITPEWLWEKYGLRPEQWVDFRALVGDPSDNLPGVKGIGEKTALKLLKEWGSLENLLKNLDRVKPENVREKIKAHLEDGKLARSFEPDDDDAREFINTLNLLTWKPVIFAANVAEDDLADDGADNQYVQSVRGFADENNCEVFVICAEIEQEIAELDDDEKKMFLDDLGLTESGLEKLIAASYRILGLMSYLTAGPQESRAWTIKVGTKAPQAAGKIHSDFERGFIRAEVVNYDDLMACGSMNAAKEKGLVRSEGKEYVMRDGDVVLFRFNV